MSRAVVRLRPVGSADGVASADRAERVDALLEDAVRAAYADPAGPDLDAALDLARRWGPVLPVPAAGRTAELWESLATLGSVDLTVTRVVEPHLDALAILSEADTGVDPGTGPDSGRAAATWGVYAAEGPRRLTARSTDEGWRLDGEKSWCSLADRVDRALVTAWLDEQTRGLFAVDLAAAGVSQLDSRAWVARGLAAVRSTGLRLDAVPATAVGGPDWYLTRPGFAWGGAGVAAVWFGAAVALGRRLRRACSAREPDQVALVHLGAVDVALTGARDALVRAAAVADAGPTAGGAVPDPVLVVARVRQRVADACAEVLDRCARALGPGPLASEEEHARRVADLELYLRQHHADRDLARLGDLVLQAPGQIADADQGWW